MTGPTTIAAPDVQGLVFEGVSGILYDQLSLASLPLYQEVARDEEGRLFPPPFATLTLDGWTPDASLGYSDGESLSLVLRWRLVFVYAADSPDGAINARAAALRFTTALRGNRMDMAARPAEFGSAEIIESASEAGTDDAGLGSVLVDWTQQVNLTPNAAEAPAEYDSLWSHHEVEPNAAELDVEANYVQRLPPVTP